MENLTKALKDCAKVVLRKKGKQRYMAPKACHDCKKHAALEKGKRCPVCQAKYLKSIPQQLRWRKSFLAENQKKIDTILARLIKKHPRKGDEYSALDKMRTMSVTLDRLIEVLERIEYPDWEEE